MYFTEIINIYDKRLESPVYMKEIKLPLSSETHELIHDINTNSLFISQMSNSVLVQIKFDDKLLLKNVYKSWKIGNDTSGLHNLSPSFKYPGYIWTSLQFKNKILLFNAQTKEIKFDIDVPFFNSQDDIVEIIGGPHSINECKKTGTIWVALKGPVGCCPNINNITAKKKNLRKCCNLNEIRYYMESENVKIPNGYAIWKIDPTKYDKSISPFFGGIIFRCLPSPPMSAIDKYNNCWVSLDCSPTVMKIINEKNCQSYHQIPHPEKSDFKITGPAIITDPNGHIWLSLLGGDGCLVKINVDNNIKILYEINIPEWVRHLKIIHFLFDKKDTRIFAIASDLLQEKSVNSIIILQFDDNWNTVLKQRIIPLPTQDCSCHRIILIDSDNYDNRSIIVTEMASSKVFQLKINNITDFCPVKESQHFDNNFVFKKYTNLPEIEGLRV